MSKHCGKCELGGEKTGKENPHDPSVYTRSLKGMEVHGVFHSCLHIHQHHNVVYKIIVMDNDSSIMEKKKL
jgi:hypothetical protein